MTYKDRYPGCSWVSFQLIEQFMVDVLKGVGVPDDDAGIITDVLVQADKFGIDSHGIGRLKPIYIDRIDAEILSPVTNIEVLKDEGAIAVLDGNNGMGHVVAKRAMECSIARAKQHGVGMVVARNSTHYGMAGYYPLMAVKEGLVGITGTNARPSIAPTFGVENMLGTNPLTFGFPTDEEFPFLLDCATSVTQRGKIEAYSRAGLQVPLGWVIDRTGASRQDTDQILLDLAEGKASLTPVGGVGETGGGYKGYGWAVAVEILSAALQDGAFMKALSGYDENGKKQPYPLGHFFIAVDPAKFMGVESFKRIAGEICRGLRNSELAPGEERIYTPGEKEWIAWCNRQVLGCPIPEPLQRIMLSLRERFSLQYDFGFD